MYVLFAQHPAISVDCCDVGQTQLTIDTIPDDALLYVFDFYVAQASKVEAWHTLVHVCRRWRNLVFESPRCLNLRITCTHETSVKKKLDVWPALPIVISGVRKPENYDNTKAALEHHDRVCQIKLFSFVWDLGDIVSLLEEPLAILTDLDLSAVGSFRPFDPGPSKFLGGSARLQSLTLSDLWILDLLKLLLSTPNLVNLRLARTIRHPFESFLPDEVITVLSAFTRLEQLDLDLIGRSHLESENRRLALLTRTVLPSLTVLRLTCVTEVLEDFIARIDAPLLDHLLIHISFDGSVEDIL
jgi:hypothetical protein